MWTAVHHLVGSPQGAALGLIPTEEILRKLHPFLCPRDTEVKETIEFLLSGVPGQDSYRSLPQDRHVPPASALWNGVVSLGLSCDSLPA